MFELFFVKVNGHRMGKWGAEVSQLEHIVSMVTVQRYLDAYDVSGEFSTCYRSVEMTKEFRIIPGMTNN